MTSRGCALPGQAPHLAAGTDIRWLGFSYVAFRLIHTLRDRMSGRLPVVSLQEYIIYVIFFPAITAGPIDRLERFIKDIRQPLEEHAAELTEAGRRLALGLFKKFVIADSLALFASMLPMPARFPQLAGPGSCSMLMHSRSTLTLPVTPTSPSAWGGCLDFKLPENFIRPYLKPNITQFWNNWHMTLTQWFRSLFFLPPSRAPCGVPKTASLPG